MTLLRLGSLSIAVGGKCETNTCFGAKKVKRSMKTTIKLALAAGAIAFTAGMSSNAFADIVVTSWGGGYTASQQKA